MLKPKKVIKLTNPEFTLETSASGIKYWVKKVNGIATYFPYLTPVQRLEECGFDLMEVVRIRSQD